MRQKILFIIAFLLVVGSAFSVGKYTFRLIDTNSGLPDNEIKALFAAPDGRLGVRTVSLLSLFDGCEFISYPVPRKQDAYTIDCISPLPMVYVDSEGRVWTKDENTLTVFDTKRERFVKDVEGELASIGINFHVKNFFVDNAKGIWAVADNGKMTYKAADEQPKEIKINTDDIRDIYVYKGDVWTVYGDGQVVCWNLKTLKTKRSYRLWRYTLDNRAFVRFSGWDEDLWLLWNDGVTLFNMDNMESKPMWKADKNAIVTVLSAGKGRAYIGVRHEGFWLIEDYGATKAFIPLQTDDGDVIDDDIQIAMDINNGHGFIGLYARGLCYYHATANISKFPFVDIKKAGVAAKYSYKMGNLADRRPVIISGDELVTFNESGTAFTKVFQQINETDYLQMFADSKQRTWISVYRKGFYLVNPDGRTEHFVQGERKKDDVNFDLVRWFDEDAKGRIYMSIQGGLAYFDEKNRKTVLLSDKHPEIAGYKVVNGIYCDRQGWVWAATTQGLYAYMPDKNKVMFIGEIIDDAEMASGLKENCKVVYSDSRGLVWVGTLNGLYVIDPAKRTAVWYGIEQGLPNLIPQSIIEDQWHSVWVSTIRGLCKFDVKDGKFNITVFDSQNKLKDCSFLYSCAATDTNGNVYFGCADGYYIINPKEAYFSVYDGHPLITSMSLFGKRIVPGEEINGRVILNSALDNVGKIILRYDENFISFNFSGLNFKDPLHTSFRYRLQGVDKDWVEVSPKNGNGEALYTYLSPGTYTFEVYSAGVDRKWSKEAATLTIEIEAPLWNTWLARTVYLMIIIGLAVGYYRWRINQNRKQMEIEKYKEVEEMKYRFFTNITHEFRTLLTLIITPLGSVLRKTSDPETNRQLKAVNRNAGDLLQLVNQLLDFRRMEMGGEHLNLQSGNLNEFVDYTVHKFESLAEQKGISLEFVNCPTSIFMYFDSDKTGKILTNLLSNAFKFTDSGGKVTVTLNRLITDSRPFARIEVRDTGCGISEEDHERVFDRFYRVENQETSHVGSGIGLSMVKEYAEIQQGTISLESEVGKGSCFIIELPADLKQESTADETSSSDEQNEKAPDSQFSDKTVLVVEDNNEFRDFMVRELGHYYNVISAEDGVKGSVLAADKNPDIIVSDVMMPRMSGTDMCRQLKANIQTSHIPVILLTAWSTDEARTEGYKAGADGYIAKPFDMEMLLVRINNLLEKQKQRIVDFLHSTSLDVKAVVASSCDEEFMKTVIKCIENNIDDSEYGIDNLAADVAMSRMSLYRKLKSLTDQTPADLIRTIRLKYAAQLLKEGNMNVSEVCYRTGFASPQNFTKRFKEAFGIIPSQYKESGE